MNLECENPRSLPALVERALKEPVSAEIRERRRAHLEKWCGNPTGRSSLLFANSIVDALKSKRASDSTKLDGADRRRAIKLNGYRRINQGYQVRSTLTVEHWLQPQRYAIKVAAYKKSIKPQEVRALHKRFDAALSDVKAGG